MAHPNPSAPSASIPTIFTRPPPIQDALVTETLSAQQEMVWECLPYLKGTNNLSSGRVQSNEHAIPSLDRHEHIEFLHESLQEFPAAFVTVDASRPWMVYWALMGLFLLGEDVSQYRDRVIKTLVPMQNPTGGFGGGHGQYSHLASTYAATLSLALVGGNSAYSLIDRESMWIWLGRLKQPDGGFQVCEGGEEDVRGAYCAMVLVSLLDLPDRLPNPISSAGGVLSRMQDGLEDWLAQCQTFEGGISGAPGNEAHGAYAFCALACLCLMNEQQNALRCLDLPTLLSWLSSRQYAPEGGFAGRTNKLVDGCYSHWVGGCWPLIQAAMNDPCFAEESGAAAAAAADDDYDKQSLCSREGLTRYILSCCQSQTGGLRDKPSKMPDSYHTCYTLAGLSSVQHLHYHIGPNGSASTSPTAFQWRSVPVSNPAGDLTVENARQGEGDGLGRTAILEPFHPLFVVAHQAAQKMRDWSEEQSRLSPFGHESRA